MGSIYVARSAKLTKWASDVGLGKHVYKVGYTEEPPKAALAAAWAGETDWTLVKHQPAEALDEATVIARLAAKEKLIDPSYYPKLKGAQGVFRVSPVHVENHIVVGRALAGAAELIAAKLKPSDFAAYLIHNVLR